MHVPTHSCLSHLAEELDEVRNPETTDAEQAVLADPTGLIKEQHRDWVIGGQLGRHLDRHRLH
jgi:GTPase involved in cell partitioning and DNA repair